MNWSFLLETLDNVQSLDLGEEQLLQLFEVSKRQRLTLARGHSELAN